MILYIICVVYLVKSSLLIALITSQDIKQCPQGKYGVNCLRNCYCEWKGASSCHQRTGKCICKKGYKGTLCEEDIDECHTLGQLACPGRFSACENTFGSFLCHCPIGYKKRTKSSPCTYCPKHVGKDCTERCSCKWENTISCHLSTGECICKPGWEGSKCAKSVNDCISNPCLSMVCMDLHRSYACICGENKRFIRGMCRVEIVEFKSFDLSPSVGSLVKAYFLFSLDSNYQYNHLVQPNFIYTISSDSYTVVDFISCRIDFHQQARRVKGNEEFITRLQSPIDYHFYIEVYLRFLEPDKLTIRATPELQEYTEQLLYFDTTFPDPRIASCISNVSIVNGSTDIWSPTIYSKAVYNRFLVNYTSSIECGENPSINWDYYDILEEGIQDPKNCLQPRDMEFINVADKIRSASQQLITNQDELEDVIPPNTLPTGTLLVCVKMTIRSDKRAEMSDCSFIKVKPNPRLVGGFVPPVSYFVWSRSNELNLQANFKILDGDHGRRTIETVFSYDSRERNEECTGYTKNERDIFWNRLLMPKSAICNYTYLARIKYMPHTEVKHSYSIEFRPYDLYTEFPLLAYASCLHSCSSTIGTLQSTAYRVDPMCTAEDIRRKATVYLNWSVLENGVEVNMTRKAEILHIFDSTDNRLSTRSNSLLPNTEYNFISTYEVTTFRSDYFPQILRKGKTIIKVRTSGAPRGDGCKVAPTVGLPILTSFTIKCSNYTDEEHNERLTYKVYEMVYLPNGRKFYTNIAYGNNPVMTRITLSGSMQNDILVSKTRLKIEIVNIALSKSTLWLDVKFQSFNQKDILDKVSKKLDNLNIKSQEDLRTAKDLSTIINIVTTAPLQKRSEIRNKLLHLLSDVRIKNYETLELVSYILMSLSGNENEMEEDGLNDGVNTIANLTSKLVDFAIKNAETTEYIATLQTLAMSPLVSKSSDLGQSIENQELDSDEKTEKQKMNLFRGLKITESVRTISKQLLTALALTNSSFKFLTDYLDINIETNEVNESFVFNLNSANGTAQFYLPAMFLGTNISKINTEFELYKKNPFTGSSESIHGNVPLVDVNFYDASEANAGESVKKSFRFSEPAEIFLEFNSSNTEAVIYDILAQLEEYQGEYYVSKSACLFLSIAASTKEATVLQINSIESYQLLVKARYTNVISAYESLFDEEMLSFPLTTLEPYHSTKGPLLRDRNLLFLPMLHKELGLSHNVESTGRLVNGYIKENHVFSYRNVLAVSQKEKRIDINSFSYENICLKCSILSANYKSNDKTQVKKHIKFYRVMIKLKLEQRIQHTNIQSANNMTFFNASVIITPYKMSCLHFDRDANKFLSDKCMLTMFSNLHQLNCKCVVAAAFTGSFFVMPRLINPLNAGLFLQIFENPLAVTMVIAVWMIAAAAFLYGRRKDKEDEIKRGVTVLDDNREDHTFVYLLCVVTGWFARASTTSNVFIILKGSWDKSESHLLSDSTRRLFQSGEENWFVLTTKDDLGNIESVEIWTDFSGGHPSWYLNCVYIQNMLTSESWLCTYNSWFSCEFGERKLRADIPAIKEKDFIGKKRLQFFTRSKHDIRNEHLWIGMVAKTSHNKFSRVQRIITGLTMLQTLMIVNLMFFGLRDFDDARQFIDVLGYKIHLISVIIGFQTSIIITIVGISVAFMFNRLAARPTRKLEDDLTEEEKEQVQSNIQRLLYNTSHPVTVEMSNKTDFITMMLGGADLSQNAIDEALDEYENDILANIEQEEIAVEVQPTDSRNCFQFPWWFIYIHWTILGMFNLFLAYYIMLYGLSLGYEKSVDWSLAFFTGFLTDILIFQPVKVVLIAFIVILILKQRYTLRDQSPVSKHKESLELLFHNITLKKKRGFKPKPTVYQIPLNSTDFQEVLERLKVESLARELMRDFFLYIIFMSCILLVVYGHLDVFTRYQQIQFSKTVYLGIREPLDAEDEGENALADIHEASEMWEYLNEVLLVRVVPNEGRSNLPESSYLLGPTRLRQARVQPDSGVCSHLPETIRNIYNTKFCIQTMESGKEETNTFVNTWKNMYEGNAEDLEDSPYVYKTAEQLRTAAFSGQHGTYSGGGFVVNMSRDDLDVAHETLNTLQRSDWLDQYTRCIFVELTLYNPSSDLFTNIILAFEFDVTGGIFPYYSVEAARFFLDNTRKAQWLQIAEGITGICVVFYTVLEVFIMIEKGFAIYVNNFWNCLEIAVLLLSYIMGILYLIRQMAYMDAIETFNLFGHARFIDFQTVFYRNFMFNTCIGILGALAIFKMLKVITFNPFLATYRKTMDTIRNGFIAFTGVSTIYLLALATSGMLIFGQNLSGYMSLDRALFNLLFFILGEADYENLVADNRILGPTYFMVVMLVTQYIIINFYVAILREGLELARYMSSEREEATVRYMIRAILLSFGITPENIKKADV